MPRPRRRIAIVFDGTRWFVRRIASITHDGVRGEMVYRCDAPISNGHATLSDLPQVRVLSVDGDHPPARLAGWKDTIALERDREYRLLVRFDDYADPTTPYMFHCHLLWHEDQGMMGQFLVVEPGQAPDLRRPEGDNDDQHDH